jgi:DNA-binding CsgD family transcriptional regulator
MLIGRRDELTQLSNVMKAAASGQARLVTIAGIAGTGKTFLMREVEQANTDFRSYWAVASEDEQDQPYGLVRQLLNKIPDAVRARHRLLPWHVQANVSPFSIGISLLELLDELQNESPIALFFDDWQWSDNESIRTLGFAARRLTVERVVILCSYRDEAMPVESRAAGSKLASLSHHIELGGFTAQEVARFIHQHRGLTVSPRAAEHLRHHTGGHPLWIQSLATNLNDQELLSPEAGIRVPESLVASIQRQFSGLPPQARSLVQALAVLNASAPLSQVAHLAKIDAAVEALECAVGAGLLNWSPLDPATRLSMHALRRDAIYVTISPAQRKALHTAAADLVAGESAWAHRVAACDGPNPDLADELEQIAAAINDRPRFVTASKFFIWASDLSVDPRVREERLLLGALRLCYVADIRGLANLKPRILSCRPGPLKDFVLGCVALGSGSPGSEDLLRRTLDEYNTSGSAIGTQLYRYAATLLTALYAWQARSVECVKMADRVLKSQGPEDPISEQAVHFSILGVLNERGANAGLNRLNVLHSRTTKVPQSLSTARGICHAHRGDLSAAVPELRDMVDAVEADGRASTTMLPHGYLAYCYYLQGRWDEASIVAEQGRIIALTYDQVWQLPMIETTAAFVAAGRGEWLQAERLVRGMEARSRGSSWPLEQLTGACSTAALAQARGDRSEMYRVLRPLGDSGDLHRIPGWQLMWGPLWIEALIGARRHADAERSLVDLRREIFVSPWARAMLFWLTGELAVAEGARADARAAFQAGIEATAGDHTLHGGLLSRSYGLHLKGEWKIHRANDSLLLAQNHFMNLGAKPFLSRCRKDIEELGFPDHQKTRTERDDLVALTTREREVAFLIGRGMTNPEIARALFISAKTVEFHVRRIFAKLSLTNRRQLRDLMQAGT